MVGPGFAAWPCGLRALYYHGVVVRSLTSPRGEGGLLSHGCLDNGWEVMLERGVSLVLCDLMGSTRGTGFWLDCLPRGVCASPGQA